MVWESFDGSTRELDWGELQDLANQAAHTLAARGVARGDRVAVVLPADARDSGDLLRRLEARRDPALDVGAVRRRRDPAPALRLGRNAARDRPRQRAALRPAVVARARSFSSPTASRRPRPTSSAPTPRPTTPRSSTTRQERRGSRRGSSTRTATSSAHEEFLYCHELQDGERFHGMGEWAWAAGIAPLLGPWRLGALQCVYRREGGFDPHKQLDFLSRHRVTNVFTTPTAMRSMMAIEDAGTRYPQAFRRVCSAGEPLNPEAIRWFREQYGVTVLDYYGLTESYPLVANYPFLEVREGSMGRPMPGWDVQLLDEDEQPVAQGERGEICLRARSNPHYPLGYWRNEAGERGDLRRRVVPHQGRRRPGRGRLRLVRRTRRRRDHRGRLPDRPVRGRIGVPRARRRTRGGGRRVARRAPRQRREGIHRPRRRIRALGDRGRRDQRTSSANASRRTRTRAGSSSSPSCRRRSPGRSAGSSSASSSSTALTRA